MATAGQLSSFAVSTMGSISQDRFSAYLVVGVMVNNILTWQNIESPKRQTSGHVCEGVKCSGNAHPECYWNHFIG